MEEAREEDVQLRGKAADLSSANSMFITSGNWREGAPEVCTDGLVGINLNKRAKVESLSNLAGSDNDCNGLVEELTLKVDENENDKVAVYSNSNPSNVREGTPTPTPKPKPKASSRQGHWKHLYQLAGGLGSGSSRPENVSKGKEQDVVRGGGGMDNTVIPEIGIQRTSQQIKINQGSVEKSKQLVNSENSSETPIAIRTKQLSSSGFSQFLVRNSLKGKGVVYKNLEQHDGQGARATGQRRENVASVGKVVSETSHDVGVKIDHGSMHRAAGAGHVLINDGILLRDWLKPGRKVNRDDNLQIFKQIVELVDIAHSQQVALQHIRPSCFKLLPLNQVKYVGSVGGSEFSDSVKDMNVSNMSHQSSRKRLRKEGLPPISSLNSKQPKIGKNSNFTRHHSQSSAGSVYKCESPKEVDVKNAGSQDLGYDTSQRYNLNSENRMQNNFGTSVVSNTIQNQFMAVNFLLEDKWYTSPEEHNGKEHTILSDIYCLGILLFELFFCYESCEAHTAAMSDLRHRILPPKFLSEYPKEVGFCLWLLHPEPSSRPRAREILHSELISESREVSGGQLSETAEEDQMDSELLLHFLLSLGEHKHKRASKLVEDIGAIEADIKEVEKRHSLRDTEALSCRHKDLSSIKESLIKEPAPSQVRLMKNISHLESAYFSMRSQISSDPVGTSRSDVDLLKNRESWFRGQNEDEGNQIPTDHLGDFFDGVCKYARYNKFELRGTLRNGDLLNSANVICSLSFDRDEEYFAAAGVSKKIKIFEFNRLLDNSVEFHYPAVEMTSKSKLSCVCWNNYIKNYLAATDYDGAVQLWDASTGQDFCQYTDHEKRAWSVDFSSVDPRKLASGSDDCSVKLWSINEKNCISTIRSFANICCVQFSSDSTHLLSFGSADYKTYCYDLRNTRHPWCTLAGHGKAVSYVKFLDSKTLISASTDNTLKLWDLSKTSCSGFSTDACSLTYRGHTNEKHFVGLSVSDGYISCGSESNEVYAYQRSLPMPITAHKFGAIDSISGQDIGDDSGQFVSSVCWKGNSDMLIAANSTGSIKLLQMM